MTSRPAARLFALACALSLASTAGAARAAEIHVLISGGFSTAFKALAPGWEKATGNKIDLEPGASMGTTPTAIPLRLARGEPADVVIMVGYALDGLIKSGKVTAGSKVELANSETAIAVKKGAPHPDISTVAALKRTLLAAKSVGYSDSASGVYVHTTLFPKLGIAEQMKGKAKQIDGTPVGLNVVSGDVQLGFQQKAELMSVPGTEIVGVLPRGAEFKADYAGGVAANSKNPAVAKSLLAYLTSAKVQPEIVKTGLDRIKR